MQFGRNGGPSLKENNSPPARVLFKRTNDIGNGYQIAVSCIIFTSLMRNCISPLRAFRRWSALTLVTLSPKKIFHICCEGYSDLASHCPTAHLLSPIRKICWWAESAREAIQQIAGPPLRNMRVQWRRLETHHFANCQHRAAIAPLKPLSE